MLFKSSVLAKIQQGQVTLAFRLWRRPTVKSEGTLRTAVGVLKIISVSPYEQEKITSADAVAAGFENLTELREDLSKQPEGKLYRIEFRVEGPDPRLALREQAEFRPGEREEILGRLEALDHRSKAGSWTGQVLEVIGEKDGITAGEIAKTLGRDKETLKRDIRKLKEMGLTESLVSGYRLSARGRILVGRKLDS